VAYEIKSHCGNSWTIFYGLCVRFLIVAPALVLWQLALGFTPRGPCAILKEAWTGETDLPPDLNSSVTDYLHELREKLAVANEHENAHLINQQKTWVNRYNLRSHDKQFYDGQAVMILRQVDCGVDGERLLKSSTSRATTFT